MAKELKTVSQDPPAAERAATRGQGSAAAGGGSGQNAPPGRTPRCADDWSPSGVSLAARITPREAALQRPLPQDLCQSSALPEAGSPG